MDQSDSEAALREFHSERSGFEAQEIGPLRFFEAREKGGVGKDVA